MTSPGANIGSEDAAPRNARTGPSPTEVRTALRRVLESDAFSGAGRLRRLLRFTVEEALGGQGDRLKEYVLGVEVFDRTESYDPRIDSIVRVEARRLRSKLAEYYDGEGANDPVRFRYRKGGYAPLFEYHGTASSDDAGLRIGRPSSGRLWLLAALVAVAAALAAWVIVRTSSPTSAASSPRIVVLPMSHYSGTSAGEPALADRLTDGVTTELARLPGVAVASRTSARQFDKAVPGTRALAAALGVRFLFEGTVYSDAGRVRVSARVVDASLDRKIWVEDFESGTADQELKELTRLIASRAAAQLTSREAVE